MLKRRIVPFGTLMLSLSAHGADRVEPLEHVVPIQEMQTRLDRQAQQRQSHLKTVDQVLSMPRVQTVLEASKIDTRQLRTAASLLTDAELSAIAAKARQVQTDVEGGALSNQQLTYIVIALVTALVVTLIFVA